ncbi:MAG: hypothetical protein ACYDG0_06510 [Vulcanimicrobiaceae bacterium]
MHVLERLRVRCPYHGARGYLERAMQDASECGWSKTIALKVPIAVHAFGAGLARELRVSYDRGHALGQFDRPWAVRWSPSTDGVYPDFVGTLALVADEDYTKAVLELEGDYEPPVGTASQMLDVISGARVASMTGRELLRTIGACIEERYHADVPFKGFLRGRSLKSRRRPPRVSKG